MTYKINGVALTLQPTSGQWMPREIADVDGAGHPVYPAVREFELRWEIMSLADFDQIQEYYQMASNTGTLVVDLPRFGYPTYTFYSYTGCTIREPEINAYFEQYHTEIVLVVTNIRTAGTT